MLTPLLKLPINIEMCLIKLVVLAFVLKQSGILQHTIGVVVSF